MIHVLYIREVVIIICVPRFVVRENKLLFCCHKADCIHLKVVFMNFDWRRHCLGGRSTLVCCAATRGFHVVCYMKTEIEGLFGERSSRIGKGRLRGGG